MARSGTSCRVAVVGAGMSGLSAALAAAQTGVPVSVIEADAAPGGSARWSSGRIWTLPDYETFRRLVPLGDPVLQKAHVRNFLPSLDWLSQSAGDLVSQPEGKAGIGRSMTLGRAGDRTAYFAALAAACEQIGVRLRFATRLEALQRNASDGFTLVYTDKGRRAALDASAVVLASGGLQGDPEMLAEYLGPEARRLMLRSNPNSKGAGLRAGLGLGAALSRGTAGFYGKSMPLGTDVLTPAEYKTFTYDVARRTIAVNIEGRRFVDEAAGLSGEAIPNASIYQPQDGRYFLILDGAQLALVPHEALAGLAARAGLLLSDLILRADTLEGLAAAMSETWGVDRAGLDATIRDACQATDLGHGQQMSPPRREAPSPLAEGPFAALACRAAITIPFGGLAVDETMAVLDRRGRRIGGLFAAGADAGGVYVGAYAGGLAWALTSGRTAGLSAVGFIGRSDVPSETASSMVTT